MELAVRVQVHFFSALLRRYVNEQLSLSSTLPLQFTLRQILLFYTKRYYLPSLVPSLPAPPGQHYEPEVGQDEYADEVGVPAPSACDHWPQQKAAFAAAKKASRPGAAPAPAEALTVPRPAGCSGACARARKAKEAGIIEIEDLAGGNEGSSDAAK